MRTDRLAILSILISLSLIGCMLSQPPSVEPSAQASLEPTANEQPASTDPAPSPTPTSETGGGEPTVVPTEPPTEEPTLLPETLTPVMFPITVDQAGFGPSSITADWENLWVGGDSRDLAVKVRPSDGQVLQVVELGKFGVGVTDLAFDGANVWALVADSAIKVRASDGEVLGSYQLVVDEAGFVPANLALDAGMVWVGAGNRDLALKLHTSTGQIANEVELGKLGIGVTDMAMYGEHMWILVGDFVLKVDYYENQIMGSYDLSFDDAGLVPQSVTAGGESIWVGGRDRDVVVKVRPDDGQVLQVVEVAKLGAGVRDLAYDGDNVWTLVSSFVVKFRASDGELLGSYDVGPGAARLRYDGTYIWVTNPESGVLIRFQSD
jgi:hypothetical protein